MSAAAAPDCAQPSAMVHLAAFAAGGAVAVAWTVGRILVGVAHTHPEHLPRLRRLTGWPV